MLVQSLGHTTETNDSFSHQLQSELRSALASLGMELEMPRRFVSKGTAVGHRFQEIRLHDQYKHLFQVPLHICKATAGEDPTVEMA